MVYTTQSSITKKGVVDRRKETGNFLCSDLAAKRYISTGHQRVLLVIAG
jgi:hypothetical protein